MDIKETDFRKEIKSVSWHLLQIRLTDLCTLPQAKPKGKISSEIFRDFPNI